MSNIFLEIIEGKKPCKKIYEDEKILAIEDAYPIAPVHILIMPKKNYSDLQSIPIQEISILSDIAKVAQNIAKEYKVDKGYRFLTNIGRSAGQSIFHLHFHLIGGKPLGPMG